MRWRVIAAVTAVGLGACAADALPTSPPLVTPPRAAAPAAPAAPGAAAAGDGASLVALERSDTRMGVDVMIDGAGPFRFIVDSGATRTVVSRQLAQLLNLPSAGRAMLHSLNGAGDVDMVEIDRLVLGTVTARNISAPALDAHDLGAAGILGIDVLAGRQVVMDLAHHRMTIVSSRRHGSAPAGLPGGEEIVVRAERRSGQLILVDADIAGRGIDVVLDTGSDTTIGNPPLQRALTRRIAENEALPVTLTDVTGRQTIAGWSQLPDLRIGGLRVMGAPAAFADAHTFHEFGMADRPAMLLGMDLLTRFRRIEIDFGSRQVRFFVD